MRGHLPLDGAERAFLIRLSSKVRLLTEGDVEMATCLGPSRSVPRTCPTWVPKPSDSSWPPMSSLKSLRQSAGLSQQQLAQALGSSQPHVNRLERGKQIPTIPTVRALAVALNVSVSDILSTIPEAE